MSLNQVMLIGRLGKDPESKETEKTTICNLSLATTEYNGETEWHRIVCFGKTAENCEKYLSKGSQVSVVGRIQTRSWEKDGQKHYSTEIVANRVIFLSWDKSESSDTDDILED